MPSLEGRLGIAGILWALAIVAFDAADGSFLLSMLACPLWLIGSVVQSLWRRPEWGVALGRAAIPVAVLAITLANDSLQRRIALGRAERVVAAIRAFHDEQGRYPSDLQELVPKQLPFVPRPKVAIVFNDFSYAAGRGERGAMLWWIDVPPHGKRSYRFDEARWSFTD